uniref:SCP domain-containing protein n=1 Tax=Monopterus albus TaxID=43700 RepID=A0A3Q3JAS3_MONAL
MFAFLICMLAVHQVHSACNVVELCPDNARTQRQIIDHHNNIRRNVKPPASNMLKLGYSHELAVIAQDWVEQCQLNHGPPEARRWNGYDLGQNLYYSDTPDAWPAVINAWADEVQHYNYPSGSKDGGVVGHYTQVVSYSTSLAGCGMFLCPDGIYLYACDYYRSGNFKDYPPYKAGRPCADCPKACEKNLCTNPCPHLNMYLDCFKNANETSCSDPKFNEECEASCNCKGKIIPIG